MIGGLFRLVYRIATAAVLVVIFTAAYVIYDGVTDHYGTADCIFVPGYALRIDGTPGIALRQRLDQVVDLYKKKTASHVIVSGGDGSDRMEQAKAMSRYLREHQVSEGDIIEDKVGTDAWGSYRNAGSLMKAHNFQSMLLVTHYYNMTFSKLELSRGGANAVTQVHVGSLKVSDAAALLTQVICIYRAMLEYYLIPAATKAEDEAKPELQKLTSEAEKKAQEAVQDVKKH